jgi:hypothetical protein
MRAAGANSNGAAPFEEATPRHISGILVRR